MATKKKPLEMTPLQALNRLVRLNAEPSLIVQTARMLVDNQLTIDAKQGPDSALNNDVVQAIWALATALDRLATENETLRRKLRRDNRRPAKKPAGELLKKEPEPAQLPS